MAQGLHSTVGPFFLFFSLSLGNQQKLCIKPISHFGQTAISELFSHD